MSSKEQTLLHRLRRTALDIIATAEAGGLRSQPGQWERNEELRLPQGTGTSTRVCL